MTTTTPRPTSPGRPGRRQWRYADGGRRDLRLDLLRGYALAAMSVNHLGLSNSLFHRVSGQSSFLISAAEAFLFISGYTIGWISVGRPPGDNEARLWSRTWVLYLATTGVTLGMILVALHTDLALWAGFEAGDFAGPFDAIGQAATLRLAVGGVDILVAYILFLLATIPAIRAIERGRSVQVAVAVGGAYALSQLASPEAMVLGFASFRAVIANAPLFLGGLLLGYHRSAIAEAWRRIPGRRLADGVAVVLAVVLGVLHARGWQDWPAIGDLLTAGNPEEPLWVRESELPVWPLLVVGLYLRVGWLIADRLWEPLRRTVGPVLLPLGQASLFTFVAHLVAIPVFLNLPGFPLDEDVSAPAATAWVGAYLAAILAAVHVRRAVLGWLRAGSPGREWLRSRGPAVAVAALAVAVIVSTDPSGQAGAWGGSELDDGEEFEDREFDDELEDGGFEDGGFEDEEGAAQPTSSGISRLRRST
ncbi:MAG: OpgC domain-containing protein [Actinomycetota bacterium]